MGGPGQTRARAVGSVWEVGHSLAGARLRAKQGWVDEQPVRPSRLETAIMANALAFFSLSLATIRTNPTALVIVCHALLLLQVGLVVWLFFTRTSMLLLRSLARQWNVVYVSLMCVVLVVLAASHPLSDVSTANACFHVVAVLVTIFSDLTNSSLGFQVFTIGAVTTVSIGASIYITASLHSTELWFTLFSTNLYVPSMYRVLLLNITMCMLSAIYTLCRFQNKKFLFLRTHENRNLELLQTLPPTTLGLSKRTYERITIPCSFLLMLPGYVLRRYVSDYFFLVFVVGYVGAMSALALFLKGNMDWSAVRRMWRQFRVVIILTSLVANIVLSALRPVDALSIPNSLFHALTTLLAMLVDVANHRSLWFTRAVFALGVCSEFLFAFETAFVHEHRNKVVLQWGNLVLRHGIVHATFFFNIGLQFGIVMHTSIKDSLQLRLMFFDFWVDKRRRESLKRQLKASPVSDLADGELRENAFGRNRRNKRPAMSQRIVDAATAPIRASVRLSGRFRHSTVAPFPRGAANDGPRSSIVGGLTDRMQAQAPLPVLDEEASPRSERVSRAEEPQPQPQPSVAPPRASLRLTVPDEAPAPRSSKGRNDGALCVP